LHPPPPPNRASIRESKEDLAQGRALRISRGWRSGATDLAQCRGPNRASIRASKEDLGAGAWTFHPRAFAGAVDCGRRWKGGGIAGAMCAGDGRRGKRVEKSRRAGESAACGMRAEQRLWTPTLRTYRVVEIWNTFLT
jgi:hypothetical protein